MLPTATIGGKLVRPERFELPTYCSGGNRSIQLSYGRDLANYTYHRHLEVSRHSLEHSSASDRAQNCAHLAEKMRRVWCPLRGERNGWKLRLNYDRRSGPASRHRSRIALAGLEMYDETSTARTA